MERLQNKAENKIQVYKAISFIISWGQYPGNGTSHESVSFESINGDFLYSRITSLDSVVGDCV